MKTLQNIFGLIALIGIFGSCQTPKQVLSKSESRMQIMDNIASDYEMSKDMMDAIMSGEHGKMLMHERMKAMMDDKSMMTKMMKDNPEMNKQMMSAIIKNAKSDTTLMSQMCKSMMDSPQMMEMMKKMKEKDAN